MTTGEAIKIFETWAQCNYKPTHDAAVMAISALRAQQELESNLKVLESNQPLTMDELRQMKGEPVWIVWANGRIKSQWWIAGNYGGNMMGFDDQYDYGKTWLAYRSNPEEANHGSN